MRLPLNVYTTGFSTSLAGIFCFLSHRHQLSLSRFEIWSIRWEFITLTVRPLHPTISWWSVQFQFSHNKDSQFSFLLMVTSLTPGSGTDTPCLLEG